MNARGSRANSGGQLCWASLLAHAECGRRCHKVVALPPEVGHRKRLEVETGEAPSRPRLQAGTVSAKLVAENCLPSRSYLAPTNPPPCPGLLGPRRSLGIPWMRRIQEWEDRRRRVFCVDAVPSSSWESGRTDIRCIAPFAIYLFWPVLVITFLGPPLRCPGLEPGVSDSAGG